MVVEEKFLGQYNLPALLVVGWEGVWGFCYVCALLIIFYFVPGLPPSLASPLAGSNATVIENAADAALQLGNNGGLMAAFLGNIVSIAFFNYCGVSVTKKLSAAHRMVLDTGRTCFIWLISLLVGLQSPGAPTAQPWTRGSWVELIGFIICIIGIVLFNGIVRIPGVYYPPAELPGHVQAGEEYVPLSAADAEAGKSRRGA